MWKRSLARLSSTLAAVAILIGIGGAESTDTGTLRIYVTDHREAIDDFRDLTIHIAAAGIHPRGEPRDSGWIELGPLDVRVDLTQVRHGSSQLILEREGLIGRYDAASIVLASAIGTLQFDGSMARVPTSDGPVAIGFRVQAAGTTELTFDLTVFDMRDHPDETYRIVIHEVRSREG